MCVGVHAPARVSVCLTLHIAIHRHTRTHTRARKARSLMGQMICVVYSHVYSAQDLCLRSVCFAAASVPGGAEETQLLKEMETERKQGEGPRRKKRAGVAGAQGGPPLGHRSQHPPGASALLVSRGTQGKMPPGVPPAGHLGYGPGGLGVNSEPSRCPPPPTGLPSPGFSGPEPGASERRAARGA